MSSRLVSVLVLLLILAIGVNSKGCGEFLKWDGDKCSDLECKRAVNLTSEQRVCVRGIDMDDKNLTCSIDDDCYTGLCSNNTCSDDGCGDTVSAGCAKHTKNSTLGYISAMIAVFFFGSNFVPVKTCETGNGIFFQWILCSAIMLAGMVVQLFRGSPDFQPLAMFGGFLWCTGNILAVPIIKCIGLSLGLCIWGAANMVAGWSSGKFGLFGLKKESVDNPVLNVVGVIIATVAIFAFASIEPTLQQPSESDTEEETEEYDDEHGNVNDGLLSTNNKKRTKSPISDTYDSAVDVSTTAHFDSFLGTWRKPIGIILSLISGVLYGVNFDPPTYLSDHADKFSSKYTHHYSDNGLDYVFSHFCGIFMTSTAYLIFYSIVKQWSPRINSDINYSELILPAFISGVMWAVADISWFVANTNLGLVTSFPLVTTGPGLVSAFWGVFVFREITGKKNFLKLGFAFTLLGTAVTMITISKN
eukprot:TRINITY_DN1306_c1_g1_i1.p1 TRINITY_DN1306_c1_g1~~TRINITY_DN1306_c1_g1_i1.p1  ORF type:complete len:473 (+),score=94.52 TRINITY_DN1306_c1_g1_i1:86-1504(+)